MATLPLPKKKVPAKKVLPMPWPKLTGKPERSGPYTGKLLVPYSKRPTHPQFPALQRHDLRDRTVFVVDQETKKVVHLVTTIAVSTTTESAVGWDTCGECSLWFVYCRCRGGVRLPGGITHTPTDTETIRNHGVVVKRDEAPAKPARKLPLPKKAAKVLPLPTRKPKRGAK